VFGWLTAWRWLYEVMYHEVWYYTVLTLLYHSLTDLCRTLRLSKKLLQPIATKLCHVITIGVDFITQVQKFGALLWKILGPKHAKFGPILHNFRLWSRISLGEKISEIEKICDRERFLPDSAKQARWTLVHYQKVEHVSLDTPNSTFSRDYISAFRGCWPLKFLNALEFDQGLLAHTLKGTAELEPGQNNWPVTRPDPVAIDPVTHWPDLIRSQWICK